MMRPRLHRIDPVARRCSRRRCDKVSSVVCLPQGVYRAAKFAANGNAGKQRPSREWIVGAKLTDNLGCGDAGTVALIGREGDCTHPGMPPATVAFTDLRQVDHL